MVDHLDFFGLMDHFCGASIQPLDLYILLPDNPIQTIYLRVVHYSLRLNNYLLFPGNMMSRLDNRGMNHPWNVGRPDGLMMGLYGGDV